MTSTVTVLAPSEPGGGAQFTEHLAAIRRRLAELHRPHTPGDVAAAMRAEGWVVSDRALLDTVEALRRSAVGAGPLDPLLELDGVTDVLVNGPDQVFVDRGRGLELSEVRFRDDAEVRRLAQRLAASVGRRLDDSAPFVDARLPDGVRVHAVLAGIVTPGTCLSLRVPARRRFTLEALVAAGAVPAAGAEVLRQVVAARLAFLISGGTGSGKTTVLGTLLSVVSPQERIVIVEDSRELAPDHPHVVSMEARPANAEGRGAITLTDLVRQSLRMRPDRLVVGEVRGAEVCDLLTAMNTGHEGGCGTVHANSAGDVPARLEALASLGGMPADALQAQLHAAVDLVVHLHRRPLGGREVAELHVLSRERGQATVRTEPALAFAGGRTVVGPGARRLDRLLAR